MDELAYMHEFEVKFQKLKKNRDNIPISRLTTIYASAYSELVGWIEQYALWFTEQYIFHRLQIDFGESCLKDNALLEVVISIIYPADDPDGLRKRIHGALIDRLNEAEFYAVIVVDLYNQVYNAIRSEGVA